jgi:5-formyltetrahydrofolate cyclo-ligase
VVAAPNEIKAREVADAAARQAGRVLVDVVTPAYLRSWLDRARQHPPDLVWADSA